MTKTIAIILCFTSGLSLHAQTALQWRQLGLEAFQEEDYLRAASQFRRALALNPNYLEAHEDLAQVFFVLGEEREAERHAREAFRLSGGRGNSRLILARVLSAQGGERLADAQRLLADHAVQEGESPQLWLVLGVWEMMRERLPLASRYFNQVVQREPTNLQGLFSLFQLEDYLGNQRRALSLAETLLRTHGAEPEVLYKVSVFFQKTGNASRAREILNRLLSLTQNWTYPSVWIRGVQQKARLFLSRQEPVAEDQLAEVASQLRRAHERDPNQALTLALLGLTEVRMQRIPEAAGYFRQAVERQKDNETLRLAWEAAAQRLPLESPVRVSVASYHAALARQEAERNRFDQRRSALRRLLTLDPLDRGARWALATVWKDLGFSSLYLDGLLTLSEIQTEIRPDTRSFAAQADRELARELEYWRDRWYKETSLGSVWGMDLSTFRRWRDPSSWKLNLPGEGGRAFRVGLFSSSTSTMAETYPDQKNLYLGVFAENFESHMAPWPTARGENGNEPPRAGIVPLDFYPKDPESGLTNPSLVPVRDPEDAIAAARRLDLDFYILTDFSALENGFRAEARLFVGATGRLIRTFSVTRNGAGSVASAIRDLIQAVSQAFPLRAPLVAKRRNGGSLLGVVPMGRLHGITVGDVLAVLKPGTVRLSPSLPLVEWAPGDEVATLTVTKVEDWLLEGTLVPKGGSDLSSIGDEVLLRRGVPENLPIPPPSLTILQREILGIR